MSGDVPESSAVIGCCSRIPSRPTKNLNVSSAETRSRAERRARNETPPGKQTGSPFTSCRVRFGYTAASHSSVRAVMFVLFAELY